MQEGRAHALSLISSMGIITLTTDFGLQDAFVAVMKGVILGINPAVSIVDITHDIDPQDIQTAAWTLAVSYRYFPAGTIHVAVVDPGVGSSRPVLLAKTEKFYFIGPDNGVLSLALEQEKKCEIRRITNERYFLHPVSRTFAGRDVMAPVAAHLSRRLRWSLFGGRTTAMKTVAVGTVRRTASRLVGEVVCSDRFGNLITNIRGDELSAFVSGRPCAVAIKNKTIRGLAGNYCDSPSDRPLAILGSFGYLEIAVKNDSARRLLGAAPGDPVRVTVEGGRASG